MESKWFTFSLLGVRIRKINHENIITNREVETMKKKAKEVLRWYNNMQEVIPNWYEKNAGVIYGKR